MPLDGAMVATPPAGTTAVPNTVVASAPYNALKDDIYNIFNTKIQPLAGGGSGSGTAIGAFDAFNTKGADIATAATVNLDTATGAFDDLTGTTTVTAVTLAAGKHRMTRAAGDFQITVGALLIGNGGVDALIKSGDLIFWEGYAGGIVRFWIVRWNAAQASRMDARRNLSVNGSLLVSVENTSTLGTANAYFYADQKALNRSADLAGKISAQRVAYTSLAGGSQAGEFKCVSTATLISTSLATDTDFIEGSDPEFVAAGWGASGAKAIMRRIEVQKPAGTYSVHVTNQAANRHCWVPYTVSAGEANNRVIKEVQIPGDTGGTWAKSDGAIGATIDDVLVLGSSFVGGTAGVWSASAFYGGAGQKNFLDNTANVARHTDFGMRQDPDNTGIYGAYRVGEVDPVYRSERYLPVLVPEEAGSPVGSGQAIAAGSAVVFWPFVVEAAKKPTGVSPIDSAQYRLYNSAGSGVTVTSVTLNTATKKGINLLITVATGLSAGNATILQFANTTVKLLATGCRLT